ncbi:MAG: outer membrane beta-barrel protein [Verrucomicrobiota bacterium]
MKRIVASVGLVALGTSGLQADTASSLTSESTKPWSVSATLRGFYDDNFNSAPNAISVPHRGTFGFEVSPAIMLSWPWEQTTVNLGYVYSFKDYQFKPIGNTDSVDMTHSFNVSLDHTFNELYRASVNDSFVIGQEPDFLRAGNTYSTFQRLSGSNIRNYGNATLDGKLTPLLGFEIGYGNAFYDYAADQPLFANPAGVLNRIEQSVHLDSRRQFTPTTVGVVGYQFADTDYTAGQQLLASDPSIVSNSRNNRGHYGYVGIDETFRPDLTGSVRVGARYTDYYNDPTASDNVSPFVQLSLRWRYGAGSYVEAGFTHDRVPTDLVGGVTAPGGTSLTLDSETSAVYATVNHRLAPNLYGNLTGQFQDSDYNGGLFNNFTDHFYTFGASLEYRVSNYLSTQLGYNYDRLESNIPASIEPRSFDRNRVFLGFTASY